MTLIWKCACGFTATSSISIDEHMKNAHAGQSDSWWIHEAYGYGFKR